VYGDEVVVNNAFNDATGWYEPRNSSTISAVSNKLRSTADTGSTFGSATTLAGLTVGKQYKIQGTAFSNNSSAFVRIRVAIPQDLGAGTYITIGETLGSVTFNANFIAIAETMYVGTIVTGHSGGDYVEFDSGFSVKEVIGGQGTQGTPLLRTSAIDEARIEYDASGNCLGLLVEEARTNLFQYSNQANQLAYHADGATTGVDTTEVTSPEGSGTVIKLNKTSTGYGFARVVHGSITSAQTLSAFVKKGTARYLGFRQLAAVATHTTFDLETNTWVQTAGSTSRGYEDYGNGWLRLWVVSDDSNSKIWTSLCITNSGGTEISSETGTVYVYGIQRELGAFPTSYIPTSGSTVARSSDVASLAVSEFGYNQDQGSVVVDFIPTDHPSSTYNQLIVSDGASKRWVYFNDTATYSVAGFDGTNQIAITNVLAPIKAAIGLSSTQGSIAANGDASANSTDVAHNGNILTSTSFDIAANTTAHIKSVQYYPLRLSNAQLQALTV
jgi:hypothetical protein